MYIYFGSSPSGFGQGIRQGQGLAVSRGSGFGVENEYSESSLRVFLQQYTAGGQCGVFNVSTNYNNRTVIIHIIHGDMYCGQVVNASYLETSAAQWLALRVLDEAPKVILVVSI